GVGVNLEIELVQGISLFPNPAAQMVRFRSEQALINSIRILNLNGKPVLESTVGSYQHQQDLSRLATGLYLIEVQTSEGVWRQKLIKQ
ncbi:MAG: T9SS type A sorting domain-containing protein, partial [Bacteroidota bacterium]